MKNALMILTAFASVTGLAACVSPSVPREVHNEVQAQINSGNQFCDQQYYRERLDDHPRRYSHWAECRRAQAMKLEETIFPDTKHLVRQKYDALVNGMYAVERHETTEKNVLKRVNEINDEYNRSGCPIEYFGADAHPQCDAI